MSEEHDIFEEMFKDSLQDLEVPVSEGLWKRIKISIWGRKKYILLLWFFIGLIGIAFGTYFFGEMKNNNDKVKIARNDSTANIKNTKAEVKKAYDVSTPKKPLNNKDTLINNQPTNNLINNSKKETSHKNQEHISIRSKTKSDIRTNIVNNKSIEENNINKATQNLTTKNTTQEKQPAVSPINLTIINKSEVLASKIDSNKNVLFNAIVSNDSLQFNDSLKTFEKDSIASIAKNKVDSLSKLDSLKEESPEITKSRFFINADGGIVLPTITYNSTNTNLAHTINHNSKSVINYNFNVQLGCSLRKNINVLVGLGYITYKNNYNYSTTFNTTDTITVEYLDSLGNTQYYNYYKDTTKTIKLTSSHQFKYLTIPIHAEYIINLSTRFSLKPSLGLILHQQIKSEMAWIDPESNKIIFKNNSDQKSFFASVSGGLKLEYQINKHFGATLSGVYIHSLTNINDSYKDVNLRPNAFNANIGMRYYFYNK